jgi:hypothetical protein
MALLLRTTDYGLRTTDFIMPHRLSPPIRLCDTCHFCLTCQLYQPREQIFVKSDLDSIARSLRGIKVKRSIVTCGRA